MVTFGRHVLIECSGISAEQISFQAPMEKLVIKLAQALNLSVISLSAHQFEPVGVTALLLLAESHLSLHTWPEHGAITLDLFSCNPATDFTKIIPLLREHLSAEFYNLTEINRQSPPPSKLRHPTCDQDNC